MWNYADLMMVIDARDTLTKKNLIMALYVAKQHLEQYHAELQVLRPLGESIKRLVHSE